MWELGILMYYLAFYSTPFESMDGKIDTKSLMAGRFSFPANDARMLTADVAKYLRGAR